MACPWPFLASLADPTHKTPDPSKSFAQAVSDTWEISLSQLPPKVVMGDTVRVKITQEELESSIADCWLNLHGRIILNKGDMPWTTQALQIKLNSLWPSLKEWSVLPLGRGFFEFIFGSVEDMQKIWALGVVNLKPSILCFFALTKAFKAHNQAQTHAQIWVRLLQLPQEYWRKKTLFEIASGLGTPLSIDEATLSRRFGMFARVLVDVDLSAKMFESVLVESEGFALPISVQYERHPLFCVQCKVLGHSTHNCKKLHQELSAKMAKKTPSEVLQKRAGATLATNTIAQPDKNPSVSDPIPIAYEAPRIDTLTLIQEQDKAADDEAVTTITLDSIQDPTLTLLNCFTLLENELGNLAREAGRVDLDISQPIYELQESLSDTIVKVPKGNANLIPHNLSVIPVNASTFSVVDPGFSLHTSCTLASPITFVDENLGIDKRKISSTPRPTLHSEAIAAFDASVKVNLDNTTSYPSMSQPVTTSYDSLTCDKLPSNQNLVMVSKPSLHSAGAFKSVQILSKFWGDEVELEDNDEAIPSTFEHHYPSLSESTKAERKQKKHVNKVKPSSFNSVEMRTLAQKGTSKANLAYNE